MMKQKTFIKCIILYLLSSLLFGCDGITATPLELTTVPPTAPSTLPEIFEKLSHGSAEERIAASLKVLTFSRVERRKAIPLLIDNLFYSDTSEVRKTAAIVMGEIGPDASLGARELIAVLSGDEAESVRISAAEALGKIGDSSAVPYLAANLNNPSLEITIVSAREIGHLTEKSFTDVNSQQGYDLNDDGIPLLVLDAISWWESEGKFQSWDER